MSKVLGRAARGVVFLAVASLAVGCGGSVAGGGRAGAVPPATRLARPALGAAAGTICEQPPGYPFHGPCAVFTLTKHGVTARLAPNHGYTFVQAFPANHLARPIDLTLGDAVAAQIGKDSSGASFPQFTGFGTTLLYVVSYAPRTTEAFALHGPIKIVLHGPASFADRTCVLAGLLGRTWHKAPIRPTISGNTLTFAEGLHGEASIERGKQYTAFACR